MEGRLLETILKGGAGSGVLRPRLVTAGSGGPGYRPSSLKYLKLFGLLARRAPTQARHSHWLFLSMTPPYGYEATQTAARHPKA